MKKSRERRRGVAHPCARAGAAPPPSARGFADAGASYAVGYGRPPVATRFKPGQSGNPGGKPKRPAAILARLMAQEVNETVEATENGQPRSLTKLEATLKQIANRAASGDRRSAMLMFSLLAAGGDEPSSAPERLGDNDALVIAELIRRFGPAPPAAGSGTGAPTPAASSPPDAEGLSAAEGLVRIMNPDTKVRAIARGVEYRREEDGTYLVPPQAAADLHGCGFVRVAD